MSSALQAIRKFRLHELNGLRAHIKRFGPLQGQQGLEKAHSEDPTESTAKSPSPPLPVVLPNPFLPHRNPKTGRWAPPKYSLRRQADLIKKAKSSNSANLLPPGPKLLPLQTIAHDNKNHKNGKNANVYFNGEKNVRSKAAWAQPVSWEGVVKPTGATASGGRSVLYSGRKRMFKGHKWERTMEAREKKKKVLLRDMKKRIVRFKMHHRRRRPNPLKPARSTKSSKLPF